MRPKRLLASLYLVSSTGLLSAVIPFNVPEMKGKYFLP